MLYRNCIKRVMDFILALFALIVLSPVLLIVVIMVRMKLGSPVIFKQERPGLNEKIFTLYKFRTMTDKKDANGELLLDSMRLTKFGRFLRSTSLDELPELWNIVRGDMAIVGPRPLAIQYLPYYTENEKKRHSVRPGLTGWAQINGRNAVGWEKKFIYDLRYVDSFSFTTDILIIIKTIKKVFKQLNIGERGVDSPVDFNIYRQNQKLKECDEMNIQGKNIILRAVEPEDNTILLEMVNNDEIEYMIGGWAFPVSRRDQKEWNDNLKNEKNSLRCIIDVQGNAVGIIMLTDIDYKNGNAEVHIKLDKNDRGKGYGTDALNAVLEYAFGELRLKCVYARISQHNAASQKLFKKCGFNEEGILRCRLFKKGRYIDVISFSRVNEKY